MEKEVCGLTQRHCQPCAGGTLPLADDVIGRYLATLAGWEVCDGQLVKRFAFKNFHETMAFVNAVAWISHREDHHPDLEVSYRYCRVRYVTHAIGGLSENDFICAAEVDALLA
jgi:4a-hydroxytetrahydrobiopterin dehydratase